MNAAALLQQVQVLVFDMDDTLCSERQYVQSGFRAVGAYVRERGIAAEDIYPALWRRFCAGERGTVFNRVLEDAGIAPQADLIAELVGVYRAHTPDIGLYPDARLVLEYFSGRKPMALLSDGYVQTQAAKLEALDIERYFNTVVLTDRLGRDCWKPSPAGYEAVMRAIGGDPRDYVYISDNPLKDFVTARALGWQTVCVRRPEGVYCDAEAPDEAHRAGVQVRDLCQAAVLIDPLFTGSVQ